MVDPNRSYHQVLEEQDDLFIPQVTYTYGDDLINQTNSQGTHTFGYDGLGSTRILTDNTGVVENSYGYQAFGELDYSYGTIENNYLFTGEQYDNNVGFYYLRARYYNPENGRFTQMDTFPGMQFEPLSLHKYLYTHADPINNIDPSGNISLGQISTAQNVQGILLKFGTTVGRLIQIYDKFESVGTLIDLVGAIQTITGLLNGDISSVLPDSGLPGQHDVDFKAALKSFSFNFPKAVGTGMGNWAAGMAKTNRKPGGNLRGFLVYMPSLGINTGYGRPVSTGAKVRFKGVKVPVKLMFGGPVGTSGNLFGVGIQMKGNRQLVRMDFHSFNSGHGGSNGVKNSELSVFRHDDFHYHVYKWDGAVTR